MRLAKSVQFMMFSLPRVAKDVIESPFRNRWPDNQPIETSNSRLGSLGDELPLIQVPITECDDDNRYICSARLSSTSESNRATLEL